MARQKLIEKQPFKGKTAILCGASEGIGAATAKEFALLGANICIVARRIEKLEEAVKEIEKVKARDSQFVEYISCDCTDMDKLKPLFEEFMNRHGVPDYLINVVGVAFPNYIENVELKDFKRHMDLNYYGQLVPTLILLPHLRKAKKGHIGFTSSAGGYIGIIGYSMYAPTKMAILGLADVLRNELSPDGIKVSVVFPPDTESATFERENLTKPEECKIMSERGGLLQPEEIAEPFVEGILKGKFYITPGEAGFLWWAKRHLPNFTMKLTDKELKKARKKMGKPYKYKL
ncbi:MAG: SDR family oxidoreductase [Promethearchaeota archaeon]